MKVKAYRFSKLELSHMERLLKVFEANEYDLIRWPAVYYCDHEDLYPNNEIDTNDASRYENRIFIPDYLGVYKSNIYKEGHIVLYRDRIKECSLNIANRLDLNFHETFNALKFIVLIHELGHWFTHWCHTNNHSQRSVSFQNQSKEVKESMAQLSFVWSIFGLKNPEILQYRTIFNFLVDHQPREYQMFRKLDNSTAKTKDERRFSNKATIIKRYNKILDENLDFEFLINGK
jgi:hypothetical protein